MNKIIIAVIGVVVLGSLLIIYSNNKSEEMMDDKEMMADKKVDDKEMMKNEDDSKMQKNDESMMEMGIYEEYSPEKLAMAETGDVILFFHASWCPSCRGLNSDIENNLKSIPKEVSILKLDYDKEVELKKKYGVTSQHTLVQVDKDGNLIKKWSGGSSLDALLKQIQ